MGVVYLFHLRLLDGGLSAHAKLLHMAADRSHMPDDPPPFLGSWRNVYVAILIYLAFLIGSFYAFTQALS